MEIEKLEKKAVQIRLDTLKALFGTDHGYVGSCMSVVDLLVAMYYGDVGSGPVMNYDPARPGSLERDYFVLSKVRSVPVHYAILADLGFFDKEELKYFGQEGGLLKKHSDVKIPGVCASIYDEGQGLSIATGIAMALKLDRMKNRVYTLIDRHELMRGNVWEAALFATHYKLDNLVAVLDNPQFDDNLNFPDLYQKFIGFGWNVINVVNGHDYDELLDAFLKSFRVNRKPTVIICRTISGKGIEFAERKAGYFSASLSEGEMVNLIPKLQQLI